MTGTCTRCQRNRRLMRADLCSACYQKLWKAGALPPAPPPRIAPRIKRDCQHKQANHTHGTRAAYVIDRCRCEACTEANRLVMAEARQVKALAQWNPDLPDTPSRLVDAGPAREHLRKLMAAGMGPKTIARKGNVAHGSISAIIYGKPSRDPKEARPPRARITRDLETRILAIGVDLADGALVDGTGTRRRLQALVAIGWSQLRLSRMLGMTQANFGHLIHGTGQVLKSTADAAARIYDQHWQAAPVPANRFEQAGITRARQVANRYGWVPPLAWDDDTIDNPAATPDQGETTTGWQERRAATTAARIEDARELLELGEHPEQIAARLGVQIATLEKLLRRHAPELAAPFGAALQRQKTRREPAA